MKRVITSVNGAQRRSGGWCLGGCSWILAPCLLSDLKCSHTRKREKDDKHFLKRVATEL